MNTMRPINLPALFNFWGFITMMKSWHSPQTQYTDELTAVPLIKKTAITRGWEPQGLECIEQTLQKNSLTTEQKKQALSKEVRSTKALTTSATRHCYQNLAFIVEAIFEVLLKFF